MYIDNFIYVAHSENKVTKGSIKKKNMVKANKIQKLRY